VLILYAPEQSPSPLLFANIVYTTITVKKYIDIDLQCNDNDNKLTLFNNYIMTYDMNVVENIFNRSIHPVFRHCEVMRAQTVHRFLGMYFFFKVCELLVVKIFGQSVFS